MSVLHLAHGNSTRATIECGKHEIEAVTACFHAPSYKAKSARSVRYTTNAIGLPLYIDAPSVRSTAAMIGGRVLNTTGTLKEIAMLEVVRYLNSLHYHYPGPD